MENVSQNVIKSQKRVKFRCVNHIFSSDYFFKKN